MNINYLHINNQTSNVNIYNENDFQILIKEISSDINGKKYFNPAS